VRFKCFDCFQEVVWTRDGENYGLQATQGQRNSSVWPIEHNKTILMSSFHLFGPHLFQVFKVLFNSKVNFNA